MKGTILTGFALLAVACGGGGPTMSAPIRTSAPIGTSAPPGTLSTPAAQPPPGTTLDACALLTDADIEQTTGRTVDTRTPGSVMGIFTNGCAWELTLGDDDITPVSIELGVISPGGLQYYETYLKPYDATPIAGIGDDAVTHDAGGISAVKGDTLVSVFVIAFGDDEEAFTRELTQAVLSRVP